MAKRMPRPAPAKPKPKASGSARQQTMENPGIEPGDHVYAQGSDGPLALKVRAAGRDGFVGEAKDGTPHRVTHDRFLGHKARISATWRVEDEGVDGAIVRDHVGRRRFIGAPEAEMAKGGDQATSRPEKPANPAGSSPEASIPLDQNDDPLTGRLDQLHKALEPGKEQAMSQGMILFLKAARPKKDQLQDRRDSGRGGGSAAGGGGRRAASPAPMCHDDMVRFRHGDVEGRGKIVGSGVDGVTIRDGAGREHQVRHKALIGRVEEGETMEKCLFFKAHIEGHTRRTKTGKVVNVQPYDTHLEGIRHSVDKAANLRERARRMQRGSRGADRLGDQEAEHHDAIARHIHALADMPDAPEHVKQIVHHGHEAYGKRGERPSTQDPEAFEEHFNRLHPRKEKKAKPEGEMSKALVIFAARPAA